MDNCRNPAETFDWLSLPDLLNLAQNAYAAACGESHPDPGQDFIDQDTGLQWADRADFLEALTRHLDRQLHMVYALQVVHKSTAACAEGAPAPCRP